MYSPSYKSNQEPGDCHPRLMSWLHPGFFCSFCPTVLVHGSHPKVVSGSKMVTGVPARCLSSRLQDGGRKENRRGQRAFSQLSPLPLSILSGNPTVTHLRNIYWVPTTGQAPDWSSEQSWKTSSWDLHSSGEREKKWSKSITHEIVWIPCREAWWGVLGRGILNFK